MWEGSRKKIWKEKNVGKAVSELLVVIKDIRIFKKTDTFEEYLW